MKFCCLLALFVPWLAFSQTPTTGPLRILYVDATGKEQVQVGPLHEAMKQLGRDGIWLDYAKDESLKAHYDAVVKAEEAGLPGQIKADVLQKLSPERRKSYETFLAQREPEKREKHPMVTNYEKRPEPLTFQHPMSVKASMERTQVPADLELQLFASEPDIRKPIAFAWDEKGRCWVCETSDYPHGLVENGRGNDSIKICEDTDGDGKADQFTVFADKLNIPTGLVFANGGVIVSQPPRFLFLKDTDGDDKADIREEIITGYGIRDTHAQASNLHYGLDNWIYGCVGYSGFEGVVGGKKLSFTMGTYRFRPDGSALEFLHQFSNNAWGHSANAAGDQFGGTANGAPIFYGGIPQTVIPEGIRVMTAKKINVVDTVHTITPNYRQVDVFNGYTSAAGSAFIESAALPKRFQGMAMVCEPTMKVISLMDVQPEGAGYVARDRYNLVASTDEWMSPVFAEVGPDGAVWFADFQNFIIQHNPTPSIERGGFTGETGVGGAHKNDLRDHARGRIYRVVSKTTKMTQPALDGDTQWARLTAQRIAVTQGSAPENTQAVLQKGGLGAVHALWTLHGLGQLKAETLRSALLSPEAILRRNAVRALAVDQEAANLLFGSGTLTDADFITRLAAWVKLAEFKTTPEIQTLVKQLASDPQSKQDEWLREALRVLVKKHDVKLYEEGPNLLTNSDFNEIGQDGLPVGWQQAKPTKTVSIAPEWKVLPEKDGIIGVRCITREGMQTSLYQDVVLKPGVKYRLSGLVKTHAFKGRVSLMNTVGGHETNADTAPNSDWNFVETIFTHQSQDAAQIHLKHLGKGDGFFSQVSLREIKEEAVDKTLLGDAKRGEEIFWKHPVAGCVNCHTLGGKGSTVGPALDGIASRKEEAYLIESLVNPNAALAEGYTATPISPMPPMNLILKSQEFEDVKAFILSLK